MPFGPPKVVQNGSILGCLGSGIPPRRRVLRRPPDGLALSRVWLDTPPERPLERTVLIGELQKQSPCSDPDPEGPKWVQNGSKMGPFGVPIWRVLGSHDPEPIIQTYYTMDFGLSRW